MRQGRLPARISIAGPQLGNWLEPRGVCPCTVMNNRDFLIQSRNQAFGAANNKLGWKRRRNQDQIVMIQQLSWCPIDRWKIVFLLFFLVGKL
jgi:hypothetical protein